MSSSNAPVKVAVVGMGMSTTVFHVPFSQSAYTPADIRLHR